MTKALAVVVSLYYLLVSGSVEYPMPYASCLGCCVVLLCCVSLSCSSGSSALLQLNLPSCILLKGALLVQSSGTLQSLLFSAFCNASWDSLLGLCTLG